MEASDGNLYGTTATGGGPGQGTVYKFTAATITATQGSAMSYQIAGSNNPTSFGASGLPSGLTVNAVTGQISGTPTVAGTYNIIVSATNAGGTGMAPLTINIIPTAPAIVGGMTLTVTGGGIVTCQIAATGNPTLYSIGSLPPGLTLNASTGVISGTPKVTGNFDVVVSATNAGGTSLSRLALSIQSKVHAFRADAGLPDDGSQDAHMPAGDGVPNLLKYAFNMVGTGPGQKPSLDDANDHVLGDADAAGLPATGVDEDGKLSVVFVRRKGSSAPGVDYVVEFCDDLSTGNWSPNPSATESTTDVDSTVERVTVKDSAPTANQRFVRVRVVAP